ncbi:MAG: diacylglycerol kinase [Deltaproteobacteria bacterium]|nr:diacylglycerol kinase [Deltaproteobacteria bacterium]
MTNPLLSSPVSAPSTDRPKVAVVLNGNAKAVNDALIADVRRVLADETLYVSQSLEQAEFIARQIVNRGYDVVLCGGGDGTFTRVASDVMALDPARPPAFGVLRLGTGNALADTLGAGPRGLAGIVADLHRAHSPDARRSLSVLKVEGRLAPFAGVGLDGLVLQDYNAVKDGLEKTPLRALGKGAPGYALAIGTRSVWRYMFNEPPEVIVRNEGAPARRMDLQGRPIGRPIPRGEVLYRGPVAIAAASTIPFYGLGLKLFPQAGLRQDRFQLRIANMGAYAILSKLPALFRGEFTHERLWDFQCSAVSIHAPNGAPFQIGGDLLGSREQVFIGMEEVQAVSGAAATNIATSGRVGRSSSLSLPTHAVAQ